jgi:ubiquinone/menaquinone biosynthesis C-methylase UbiE
MRAGVIFYLESNLRIYTLVPNLFMKQLPTHIKKAYDKVAENYGQAFYYELYAKHLDVKLLDLFCERVNPNMPVCEIGCGPGEIATYLKYKGINMVGVDFSEEMIKMAKQLNPHIDYQVGDVFSLNFENQYFSGVLAPFLFVNYEMEEIKKAFVEIRRVLAPDGLFYLSFHAGNDRIHVPDFLVPDNPLEFIFLDVSAIEKLLNETGFEVIEWIIRSPYQQGEHKNNRAYIFSRTRK